ncbi:hypothetical protein RB213_002968 [Colletotrichum asianum]
MDDDSSTHCKADNMLSGPISIISANRIPSLNEAQVRWMDRGKRSLTAKAHLPVSTSLAETREGLLSGGLGVLA